MIGTQQSEYGVGQHIHAINDAVERTGRRVTILAGHAAEINFSLNHRFNVIAVPTSIDPTHCSIDVWMHRRGVELQKNKCLADVQVQMPGFNETNFESSLGVLGIAQGNLENIHYTITTNIGESPKAIAQFLLRTANLVHKYA